MIRSVYVRSPLYYSATMELANPYREGFNITNITGLGAPKSSVSHTPHVGADGSRFDMSRAEPRSVSIHIHLVEGNGKSIEWLRQRLYKLFPVKQLVNLKVTSDLREVGLNGYVENVEPDIFSDRETVKVDLLCLDPWLYDTGSKNNASFKPFGTTYSAFEFPFENVGLNTKTLVFGESAAPGLVADFTYEGDVINGFVMRFKRTLAAAAAIPAVTVNGVESILPSRIVSYNRTVEISTVPGNVYVREGALPSLTTNWEYVDSSSLMKPLKIGVNSIAISKIDGWSVELMYQTLYQGV